MVSRVTLMKRGQWAVLQGMQHVAPSAFYEHVQLEMDNAAGKNHLIFREGINTDGLPPPGSLDEKFIRAFWMHWFESYKTKARQRNWQLQRDCLIYPDSAILADIDLAEMSKLLYDNGFRCKLLTFLLDWSGPFIRLNLIKRVESAIEIAEGKEITFGYWEDKLLIKFFLSMGKILRSIVITKRNHVAMDIVRKHDDGRDIFLTYGDAHIPGLMNLFLLDGWAVESTKAIDPETETA